MSVKSPNVIRLPLSARGLTAAVHQELLLCAKRLTPACTPSFAKRLIAAVRQETACCLTATVCQEPLPTVKSRYPPLTGPLLLSADFFAVCQEALSTKTRE